VKVLGMVANTHDSGIAVVENGVPILVFEEERFNRTKRTMAFPSQSLLAAQTRYQLDIASIDAIVTPWNVSLLRRSVARALLKGFPASLNLMHQRAHPTQRNQILILNSYLKRGLATSFKTRTIPNIVNVGHHDSHAASFFVSPFDDALVLVMDGYGDDASSSAYVGRGNTLKRVWSTPIMNSLGLVYTVVTEYLGFSGFGDEGKVMALAAYGQDTYVRSFADVIKTTETGYEVDMAFFGYDTYGSMRPFKPQFFDLFGPPRQPHEPLTDRHRDLAFALQATTERVVLHVVRQRLKVHPSRNLVLTGGVALNCVANARVLSETGVDRLWVPPCASDTGAPLGAALWHTHQTLNHPRCYELTQPYFGVAYTPTEIDTALSDAGLIAERIPHTELILRTARDLADGKIVGWFQDRFEMGPRALGNRSILADPRTLHMRDVINTKIKKRESFRPFAPVVPAERADEIFEISQPDPFMTLAPRVRPEWRDRIAAAVHVDGTGRIQTVTAAANPHYHALITAFGDITGVPVLINTSFNEQEPIVNTPAEAIACFQRTDMDILVLADRYVRKIGDTSSSIQTARSTAIVEAAAAAQS
jgi:carbamoyltransferase